MYIGGGSDNTIHALRANTGAPVWNYTTTGHVESTPAVSSGIVFAGDYSGNLIALNAITGTLIWSKTTSGAIRSSPAVANGIVYVGSEDDYIYAFNASSGTPVWSYKTNGYVDSSPAIANGVLYVASASPDGYIYAIDATTGAFLWKCNPTPIITSTTSSLAVVNGVIYGGSGTGSTTGYVYAVSTTTHSTIWSNYTQYGSVESSPAVVNGLVYVGCDDHNVYAFDAATGNPKWQFTTGDEINSGSPGVANGIVYIASEDGYAYALDANTGNMIWKFKTCFLPRSSTVIINGVWYVASQDSVETQGVNLYALNLGASQPAPIFVSATTNTAGTAINITFNKAMNNPSGDQGQFTYSIDGGTPQLFSAAALDTNSDVIDLTTSGTPIAYGNVITVNYTAGTVTSTDDGILATFSNQPVTNMVPVPPPTPPTFVSAMTNTAGTAINITFSKAMKSPTGDQSQFTYSINGGAPQSFSAAALDSSPNVINLTISGTTIANGEMITVNYTAVQ